MIVSIDEMCERLRAERRVLVCSHVSPDPDAVGSSCGLALGLAELGISADVYLEDGVPENMERLAAGVRVWREVPAERFSAVVAVDTSTRKRVGKEVERVLALGEMTANIDHHVSNVGWAEVNLIDPRAASSSEIVLRILKRCGIVPPSSCAALLFAGVIDDTGCFRFGNTNSGSFEAASELFALGASPAGIANDLYYSVPLRSVRLKGLALSRLRIFLEGRVAILVVTNAMLQEAGARAEDTDGLVDEVRSIRDVECAVLIRELPDRWKVSLRSKNERLDVNAVAATFGGGGHAAAAGMSFTGDLAVLEAALLSRLGEFF